MDSWLAVLAYLFELGAMTPSVRRGEPHWTLEPAAFAVHGQECLF